MSRIPVYETSHRTLSGEEVKVLTIEPQYTYKYASDIRPSVLKKPVGYLEMFDNSAHLSTNKEGEE